MRNRISSMDIESPPQTRAVRRNRQLGKVFGQHRLAWNNNRTCYSAFVLTQKNPVASPSGNKYLQFTQPPEDLEAEGATKDLLFVVFSYGSHHPLYVYDFTVGKWFENTHRASQTTTRHASDAHPRGEDGSYLPTTKLNRPDMWTLCLLGFPELIKAQLKR